MIAWLISVAGGLILRMSSNSILQQIGSTLSNADSNEAQVAMKQIAAETESRRLAQEIRVATSGFWEMRLITFIIAMCFTLHLVLVTLDTCFALGLKIAKFPQPFDQWEGAILLSFFGVHTAQTAVRGLITVFSKRGK